ncbi:MAG: nitroreductase family protein [Deltaproteobacteria bacterium]|jgi:nitroreductase|nr:nitroreductase family protein [Deltaproteobacteria bacterium]
MKKTKNFFSGLRRRLGGVSLAALGLALALSWACPPLVPAASADVDLPAPQTEGGIGVFEALKKRHSAHGGDFSAAEVTLQELSTVLWAASGLNRGQTGWTVPMAEGLPPYVKVFVAGPEGVFRYDWAGHKLVELSKDNVKGLIADQAFVAKAYYVLVFASDNETVSQLKKGKDSAADFIQVLVGSMTQNVYLAAASLKLGTRYIHSIREAAIVEAVGLSAGDRPIALMLLGK